MIRFFSAERLKQLRKKKRGRRIKGEKGFCSCCLFESKKENTNRRELKTEVFLFLFFQFSFFLLSKEIKGGGGRGDRDLMNLL